MATLNLTANEFSDLSMIWLFDQIMNPEQIQNKNMKEFVDRQGTKIKTPLMKYYLDSTTEDRVRYKRIKGVFDGSDKSIQQIRIGPDESIKKVKKGKEGIAKKIIKKILAKEELTLEDMEVLREFDYELWNKNKR